MTNQLEIEIGDTVSLRPHRNYKQCQGVCIDICFGGNGTYKISWDDYNASWVDFKDLILIKKGKTMKEFTKSDLKAGVHFVKDEGGIFRAVCRNALVGEGGFVKLSSFTLEFTHVHRNHNLDIVEVYEVCENRSMSSYLQGLGLKRVWKRTEQTPAQKEMEVLQAKMDELQEQMKVVQAKL
jgi:hypothetical protein